MEFKVITFYKYQETKEAEVLRDKLRGICEELNLLGRILISHEGINGAISGKKENVEEFKCRIREFFEDLTFREQEIKEHSYHKLVVRVRNEIVALGKKVDIKDKGEYLEPEILKEMLDKKKDIVLLDMRNDYETKVGKFKGAITLEIEKFRDLPKAVNKIKNMKDKKIVTYCTGGIRCEKASALLRENGFKDLYQLKGGIIDFVNKFPNSYFEGSCFVFDDRLVSSLGSTISSCEICGKSTDIYVNCHNLECDRLFLCCKNCQEKMNNTCCEECKEAPKQRKGNLILAVKDNYYK